MSSVIKTTSAITLNEPAPGYCPVCREHYANDTNYHCACTRPRPGDVAEMDRAYLQSALCRTAKLHSGSQIPALHAMRQRPRPEQDQGPSNVVSINIRLPRWRRRAR